MNFVNVHFGYDVGRRPKVRVEVLRDINLALGDGEFVAVLGPSGCGKSTLLNLGAGFQHPHTGCVLHRGREVRRPEADLGVVFQKPALYPWMSVLDNVLFGPRATRRRSGARRRALSLLEEVGLAGYEAYRPYELSGGMQHRVALVRTLVNEPKVLLMDEPFAALDAQTRGEMQILLSRVWEHHKKTVFFVTHDIQEALLLADRVVVMSRGPGTILADIPVSLARPRDDEVIVRPDFVALMRQVRSFLQRPSALSS